MENLSEVTKEFEIHLNKMNEIKSFVEAKKGSFKRWPIKNCHSHCMIKVSFSFFGFMENHLLMRKVIELL